MTTLADELDLDPAFNDISLSDGQRGLGGVPMSMDMGADEEDDYDRQRYEGGSSSSVDNSPVRRNSRRTLSFAKRGRKISMAGRSSFDEEEERQDKGFSLADELGGNDSKGNMIGHSIADDVNEFTSNDEDLRPFNSYDTVNEEAKARKDQEHYLISSETLGDSIRQTNAFLVKLRKIADTGASTNPSAVASSLPTSISSNSITGATSGVDDTAAIESTAAGIVRQLRDHAQLREGQLRELQECDRIIRRAFEEGGEYLIALAESADVAEEDVVQIPVLEDDKDPLGIAAAATMIERRNHLRDDSILSAGGRSNSTDDDPHRFLDEEDNSAMTAVSPTQTFADLSRAQTEEILQDRSDGKAATPFQNLIKLQQSTSDLIVSLGVIHEHSQIAHASMGDAQRRIRNIRTVLTNWQEEIKSVEKSQSWIASWESGVHNSDEANRGFTQKPEDVREWTQGQLDKFQYALDEAHVKAKELLKPVRDPILDDLAATKA